MTLLALGILAAGLGATAYEVYRLFVPGAAAPPSAPSAAPQSRAPAPVAAEVRRSRTFIELAGPPCRATVRFHTHAFWSGERLRNIDYTEFAGEIEGDRLALRVATQEWHSELGRFYASQDIVVGAEAFDRRYVILCNPAAGAKQYLDDATRARIWRLDGMGAGGFMLTVRPRMLVVRVGRRIAEADLQAFIDDCNGLVLRVADVALASVAQIEAVAAGKDVKCRVCGTAIEVKRVLCKKCRTPHHEDCWKYNDGCSIFACGERESAR